MSLCLSVLLILSLTNGTRMHVIDVKLNCKRLADGAYEFNDSIHNIPAFDVVGNTIAMPQGSLRSAWEEILFLAFGVHVTNEIF